MNQTELQNIEQRLATIRGDDLFDARRNRTLMYGEDVGGEVRHTFVDTTGKIRGVVYARYMGGALRDEGWAVQQEYCEDTCNNEDFVPSAKACAAFTDYEFACRMLEAGIRIPFDQDFTPERIPRVLSTPAALSRYLVEVKPLREGLTATLQKLEGLSHYLGRDYRLYVLDIDVDAACSLGVERRLATNEVHEGLGYA